MTLIITLGPNQRVTIFEDPFPPAQLAVLINAGKMTLSHLSLKAGEPDPVPGQGLMARQFGD